MNNKTHLLRFLPIVIFVIFVVVLITHRRCSAYRFCSEKISAVVIKRTKWELTRTTFTLSDGTQVDSTAYNEFALKVGDSIVKQANSENFVVYREGRLPKYAYRYKYSCP